MIAKNTMMPIFVVTTASPTEHRGSGRAGTKNLRVRKTAIKGRNGENQGGFVVYKSFFHVGTCTH